MTDCLFLLGRFIKGLPVNSAVLPEELKKAIGLEAMSNGISYVLNTKVNRNTDKKKNYAQFVQFFFYFIRTWTLMGSLFFVLSSQIASQILEGLVLPCLLVSRITYGSI